MKARLILADDHPMVRQGLRQVISSTCDMEVVAEATTGVEAEHLAKTTPADLLILDIAMPVRNGIHVTEALRADGIELPILIFTMAQANQYRHYVEHVGVQGFVGKDAEATQLLRAIRKILAGGTCFPDFASPDKSSGADHPAKRLSRREVQILEGLMRGVSQVQIAAELGISAASANTYRRRLLEKLGVKTNAELIQLKSNEIL